MNGLWSLATSLLLLCCDLWTDPIRPWPAAAAHLRAVLTCQCPCQASTSTTQQAVHGRTREPRARARPRPARPDGIRARVQCAPFRGPAVPCRAVSWGASPSPSRACVHARTVLGCAVWLGTAKANDADGPTPASSSHHRRGAGGPRRELLGDRVRAGGGPDPTPSLPRGPLFGRFRRPGPRPSADVAAGAICARAVGVVRTVRVRVWTSVSQVRHTHTPPDIAIS